jgi:hypothetical protein
MVYTKRVVVKCFDKRCPKYNQLGAEYMYFKFHDKYQDKDISFTSFYCQYHQYLDIDKTWWKFEYLLKYCQMREEGKTYREMTDILNKEFNLNLTSKSTPKGFDGSILKKNENIKKNYINWQSYIDDEKVNYYTLNPKTRI